MAQRIGVVLAGGAGRRMGADKARLEIGGRGLAEIAASTLWPLCGSVLVSVAPGSDAPVRDLPIVEDTAPAHRGPLAGIDAAFRATGGADLLVLACDYPYLPTAALERLVAAVEPATGGEAGDVAAPDVVLWTDPAGRDHPLVALWRRTSAPAVAAALAERRYKVRALLAELDVARVSPAACPPGVDLRDALRNVNHPEDLWRA